MNQDDIIRMAQEAEGIQFNYRPSEEFVYFAERFAALVAAAEREACAQLCESRFMGDLNREDMEARRCAAAIRSRGEA